MHVKSSIQAGALLALAVSLGSASAQDSRPSPRRAIELPPSADLSYDLSARQKGFTLKGDALVTWRAGDGKYSIQAESRVALLGTITEDRSQGVVDAFGLAPAEFWEKRLRKDPTTTTFDRETRTLRFSEGKQTYPLKGGEQDRVSITWQLASVARAAGSRLKPGTSWSYFVAGRRDGEVWTFKVVKREKIKIGLGEVEAVLLSRETLDDEPKQTLDVWLAPAHEWYPVRLRYTDGERESIEQTLREINKR